MSNPQKENGYTAIANEILERLVNTPLLGSEFQVLLFIIRKTYGYRKKADRISLTQFEKGTGLSRPTVVKTLKNLMVRNMVVKIYLPDGKEGYTFIKDHEKWVVKTHLLVKGKWSDSKDVLTETSKDVLTHKRKKEIIQKKENSLNYLKEIPEEDLEEFYSRFDCDKKAIKSKAEDLVIWCEANGKRKKNYKMFLLKALKKDFPERKGEVKKQKVVFINDKPTIINA